MADSQRKWGSYQRGEKASRNPGRSFTFNETHYLEKSFDFYPCKCQFNKKQTVKLALRCDDCLMSTQSRIVQMKTKI